MSYVLNLFNDFNRLFQSEKPLLHQLKPEVRKLIKTIASDYMDFNYCKAADAYKIEYANPRFYWPLETIYLGVAAQASIDEFSIEKYLQPKLPISDMFSFLNRSFITDKKTLYF